MQYFARSLLLLLLLASPLLGPARGHRRFEFARSTDFLDATNWRSGAPPCPRDAVRLPERSGRPPFIGVSSQLTLRELRLPGEGSAGGSSALVLFDGARLTAFDESISTSSIAECATGGRIRDAVYNLTQPLDWFKPDHWRQVDDDGSSVGGGEVTFDALPVDRVPGPCDNVTFGARSGYWLRVLGPAESVPVGSLEFAGRRFESLSDNFEAFWRDSKFVAHQFVRSPVASTAPDAIEEVADAPPLTVSSSSAPPSSCDVPLPVSKPSLMARVCASGCVEGRGRRLSDCHRPIPAASVVGACCDICGPTLAAASVSLRATGIGQFSLARLRSELAGAVRGSNGRGTRMRLSALGTSSREPMYQIVIIAEAAGASAEVVSGEDARTAAVEKALSWMASRAAGMHFAIVRVQKTYQLGFRSGASGLSSGATASVAAVVVTISLLIVAVIAAVFIGRRRGWSPLDAWQSWRQWQRHSLRDDQAEAASAKDDSRSDPPSVSFSSVSLTISSMAFTNPAYDVSQPQLLQPPGDPPTGDREP